MHVLFIVAVFFGAGVLYQSLTASNVDAWLVLLAGAMGTAALLAGTRWQLLRLGVVLTASIILGATIPASTPVRVFRGGLARLTVDVERSACGVRGCSANAAVVACTPIDPGADVCPAAGSTGFIRSERELAFDARFELLARNRPVVAFRNPSPSFVWPFSPATFFARVAPGVSPRALTEGGLSGMLSPARVQVRKALDSSLAPVHAGIARALILGEGQAVDPELNDAIRTSGVSHVLAVSGMHVTVLAGALVWLLGMFWLRTPWASFIEARRISSLLGVGLAPLVALFAGSSPSAMRAGIASSLTYAVWALGRRPNALAVAALAWIGCSVAFPRDALHPGLVLSVLATQALLMMTGESNPWARAWLESARTWLATLPFLLVAFGTLSVVGMAANVLLAPFGTLLIPLVVMHTAIALLAPFAVPVTTWIFETASGAFVVAAQVFARIDPGFQVPPLTATQAAALCIASATLLLSRRRKVILTGCALALSLFACSEWRLRTRMERGHMEVRFLDVGQGDSALIETHDGKRMLIDSGGAPQGGPDPGQRAIVPLLSALRISELDVVVLSHPHPDHYGGLAAIIDRVRIKELWDSGEACAQDEGGAACALLQRARAKGTRVREPAELCSNRQRLSTVSIDVLAPCPGIDQTLSTNDNSLVLRVRHGARSFLFMGDAEHEREERLVAQFGQGLRADVLKVGHHGSRSSTTELLLKAARPWLAIVSAGRGNPFGHPHEEVSGRLDEYARHILRIDQVGGVVIDCDGRSLEVQTFQGRGAPLRGPAAEEN
jgi:competence protein ComEC